MTQEEAIGEAREIEQAVIEAFGRAPSDRFSVKPTGIQFVQTDGRIWWFGKHGWTTAQEQAVAGLYKHCPRRAVMSQPQRWEIRRDWNL